MNNDRGIMGVFNALVLAYPRDSALVTTILLFAGLAEGFGIATLLPLLGLVTGGEGPTDTGIGRIVAEALNTAGVEPTIGVLTVLILVLMTMKMALFLLAARQVGLSAARVEIDLRLALLRALMHARWEHFVSRKQGSLANAVTYEARNASETYVLACRMMSAGLQAAAYIGVALLISWRVTVVAVIGGAAVLALLNGFVRMARRAGERQTELLKSVSARLVDGVQGIKPLKAMGSEERLTPLLESDMRSLFAARRREVLSGEGLNAVSEFVLIALMAVGIVAAFIVWKPPVEAVLLSAFLAWRTFGRMRTVQANYQWLSRYQSAFWSLRLAVDEAEEVAETSEKTTVPSLKRAVTLENVSFTYGTRQVLKNVSMTVPVGSFVALTGPSGAGKTTIADLMIGLFRPDSGNVLVDGVPVTDLSLKAWRNMIGYAPQDTILFHDTVYRNVTLDDPGLTRADAEEAARASGAWEFISTLPDGMEWIVGEKGARLSGGQRQRIAIARALVRRPRLLILDEATTSLDPESEAVVCSTLERLRGEVTILAISHQPALVNAADQVYRLDNMTLYRETLPASRYGTGS